ncbi:MAG: alpha/beta hydrolase [Aestuariivirga sp.]
MMKLIYAFGILLILGGFAYHFAALEVFCALMPKDAGSHRVKSDVPFGPDDRQKLDIYAPATGTGPWPVVVFVYGGSWNSGNKEPYAFVGRALAAQGFLTIIPNYRLHPKSPFPSFIKDTALALDWATRHAGLYGGDQNNIFAAGHSAGAYNLALAVLDKSNLAELNTDTSVLRGVVTLSGPFDFLPLDTKVSIDTFGAVPDLATTQPINYVRADAPPFLILHGSADTTVRPRNATSLFEKLKSVGADVSLKIYPDIGHIGMITAFARPFRYRVSSLADTVAFFKARVK